jgi:CubicO group peptidase (beta-lactamase class C family)
MKTEANVRMSLARIALFVATLSLFACGGGDGDTPRTETPTFNPQTTSIPVSGPNVAGIEKYDLAITGLMQRHNLPGAAFAVAKGGKLIVARGYGYADFEARQPVQPDSMFRIASNSKVLTAAAILRLAELGLVDLDRPFLEILAEYQVQPGGDPRLRTITLRHLLQHSGGWDRAAAGDPVFETPRISAALGVRPPLKCADIVRYMMSQPLQFAPGSRVVYSNVGACILGRVVERITGEQYEHYVRNQVLAGMGVHAMSIGYGQLARRGPYEVKYYMYDGAALSDSVFPGEGKVSAAYANDMITFEATGGWVGSAIDLTRVMTAIDGSRVRFLSDETLERMTANPGLPGNSAGYWFGLGVLVGPTPTTWSKDGSLPGAESLLVRNRNGYTWAFITNTRMANRDAFSSELVATVGEPLIEGLHGSSTDLYLQYTSPSLPARGE